MDAPSDPTPTQAYQPQLWVMWANAALSWTVIAFCYLMFLTFKNIKWARRNSLPWLRYLAPIVTVISVTATMALLGMAIEAKGLRNPASVTPLGNSAPTAAKTPVVPRAVTPTPGVIDPGRAAGPIWTYNPDPTELVMAMERVRENLINNPSRFDAIADNWINTRAPGYQYDEALFKAKAKVELAGAGGEFPRSGDVIDASYVQMRINGKAMVYSVQYVWDRTQHRWVTASRTLEKDA